MKTASVHEIKKELSTLSPAEVMEACMRLVKYKKENKELLTYLLFEAHDEDRYIENVKELVDEQFAELNSSNSYLAKKTIRKALRTVNKYAKYSKNVRTEIELRLYFCAKMKQGRLLSRWWNTVINNIFDNQVKKIRSVIEKMHEDLQSDYNTELENLLNG